MLELLEQQKRLTRNQKKIVAAAVIGDMLDYFDFGLIGFALAFIVGPWKLTYGQSAVILLTSGIGGVRGLCFTAGSPIASGGAMSLSPPH